MTTTSVPVEPPRSEPVSEDATLVELMERYQQQLVSLTALRVTGRGDVAAQALAVLKLSMAILADLRSEQYHVVRAALTAGAAPAVIAVAAGWSSDRVADLKLGDVGDR